jgi:hypothetical protein
MHSEALLGWEFVMSKMIVLEIHRNKFLTYLNVVLWIQCFHESYAYIKFLEGFSTCSHELLLLVRVTQLDTLWKVFFHVDRSLVASSENVVVPAMSFSWSEQGGRWLETRGICIRFSPLLCASCKEFLQQRCVSHMNLIMGCVVRKLTASGAASVCTLQWNLHLMFSRF